MRIIYVTITQIGQSIIGWVNVGNIQSTVVKRTVNEIKLQVKVELQETVKAAETAMDVKEEMEEETIKLITQIKRQKEWIMKPLQRRIMSLQLRVLSLSTLAQLTGTRLIWL